MMAVSMNPVERTLKDLELEITCAVCKNHYTDPKILPCLHYYCKACVGKLALKAGGQGEPFPCPECRRPTVLPDGGEDELQSIFVINRLQSMYDKHKRALNKQVVCEICSNSEAYADHICRQCDKFVCKDCALLHSVMKTNFEGHECVPVENLDKILIQREQLPASKNPIPKVLCSAHKEPLKVFCFDCNKLICGDCIVRDHRAHNIEFSNVVADSKKKELKESLKPLKDIRDSFYQALEDREKANVELVMKRKSAVHKVKSSFEELHNILDQHQTKLISSITRMTEEKLSNVSSQTRTLSHFSGKVQDVINYTEQCMQSFSDEEVMSKHEKITHSIQTHIKHKQEINLDSVEKNDFVVEINCTENLQQLCSDLYVANHPTLKVLNLKHIPRAVDVLVPVTFELSFEPVVSDVKNLKCQLRFLSTGAITTAKISEKNPYKYIVTYIPTMCGLHELEINAYDHPLPGTPIPVNVDSFF